MTNRFNSQLPLYGLENSIRVVSIIMVGLATVVAVDRMNEGNENMNSILYSLSLRLKGNRNM